MAMVEQTPARVITDEDLLSFGPKARAEVIAGELVVDMAPNRGIHGRLTMVISNYLETFVLAHDLGRVFSEMTAFKLKVDEEGGIKGAVVPDAAYVSYERLPHDAALDVILQIAPDIAVEVISRIEAYQDVLQKTDEYLDSGVQQVWLVLPERREVRAFSIDNRTGVILTEQDDLTGGETLPGFSVLVRAIFDEDDAALRLETLRRLMQS